MGLFRHVSGVQRSAITRYSSCGRPRAFNAMWRGLYTKAAAGRHLGELFLVRLSHLWGALRQSAVRSKPDFPENREIIREFRRFPVVSTDFDLAGGQFQQRVQTLARISLMFAEQGNFHVGTGNFSPEQGIFRRRAGKPKRRGRKPALRRLRAGAW